MTDQSSELAALLTCPACGGEKKVLGFFPVYEDHVPEEDRRPVIELNCPTCDGLGEITREQLTAMAAGQALKKARLDRDLGLRECAEKFDVMPIEWSYTENGKRGIEAVERLMAILAGVQP